MIAIVKNPFHGQIQMDLVEKTKMKEQAQKAQKVQKGEEVNVDNESIVININ